MISQKRPALRLGRRAGIVCACVCHGLLVLGCDFLRYQYVFDDALRTGHKNCLRIHGEARLAPGIKKPRVVTRLCLSVTASGRRFLLVVVLATRRVISGQ